MPDTDRIVLAHEPAFALGRLGIQPGTREIVREGGAREILEPRVMQVLVALAKAQGTIVTRDELFQSCWDGRIVGDDALNRVLTVLRRLAQGAGSGSFRIETITKVGYRLTIDPGAATKDAAQDRQPLRRRALIAVGATSAVLAAAGWWWKRRPAPESNPRSTEIAGLMLQAETAVRQATHEGLAQAIGLYRRVLTIDPGNADSWGGLGIAYAISAQYHSSAETDMLRTRARSAAKRALSLDHHNGLGEAANAFARPLLGNWLLIERALRTAIQEHPSNEQLYYLLATTLSAVGRNVNAAALYAKAGAITPPPPGIYYYYIQASWSAGKMEETDRLIDEASSLYPTHFAIWFARCYIAMFSGRADAALALLDDVSARPSGIPAAEFDRVRLVAKALVTHAKVDVDLATRVYFEQAHLGAGYAEVAIQFAAALGNLDTAFDIAEAYYFGRGFEVPEVRFTPEQGGFTPRRERLTAFLFYPVLAAMKADARFDSLVAEIGLKRYWANAGALPDYRRG